MKQPDANEELALIVAQAGDDVGKAEAMLAAGQSLSRACSLAVRMGYGVMLAKERHEARVRLRTMPAPSVVAKQMAAKRAQANIASIYTLWMVGSKPLGRCTKAELLAAADRDDAVAEGSRRNGVFHRSIAMRMPDSKPNATVAEVVDVLVTHELRAQAFPAA